MIDRPVAVFKVSEAGRNGELRVYADRIERSTSTNLRRNTGVTITPFNRVASVSLQRHARRQEVHIFSGAPIVVRVYGDAGRLVQLLNDGMAGRLSLPAPVYVGPPPGWYPDPAGWPLRRWWDGRVWTEHTQD